MYIYIHIYMIHILLVLSIYVVSLLASYLIFIALCHVLISFTSLRDLSLLHYLPLPSSPLPQFIIIKSYLQPSWTLSAKKIKVLLYFSRTPFQFFFWFSDNPGQKLWQKRKMLIFYAVFLLPLPLHQCWSHWDLQWTNIDHGGGGEGIGWFLKYLIFMNFYEFKFLPNYFVRDCRLLLALLLVWSQWPYDLRS